MEEPRRSVVLNPLVAVPVGLLVGASLYVLSIGPVAGYVTKTGQNPEPTRSFYTPVIWLHDHTPLKEPLEWYVALWGAK